MEVQINVWAVLLATASSMVVGSIWYSQAVFGKQWMKLANVKAPASQDSWKPIATTLVVSLITAYVLAHVIFLSNEFFSNSFLQEAVTTSLWLWLGLTAARFITHDAFEGRRKKLTLINIGNEFTTILVMGLIIGLFGSPA